MIINTYLGQQLCAIFLFVTFCGVLFSQEEEVRILPGQEHIEYNTAGAAKFQTGEYDAAIQDFKKSLEYNGKNFYSLVNYANLLADDDPAQAITLYQQALAIKPDQAIVLGNLGILLHKAGRLDEALGHVDALLELQPSAEFSLLRAEVLAELGRVDEARAAVREVLERSPRHQGALDLERRLTNG